MKTSFLKMEDSISRIELFGVQSETYNLIKTKIEFIVELNGVKVELVEYNNIKSIVTNQVASIPLVKFSNHTFSFAPPNNIDEKLLELYTLLKSSGHTSSNCQSCKRCTCIK